MTRAHVQRSLVGVSPDPRGQVQAEGLELREALDGDQDHRGAQPRRVDVAARHPGVQLLPERLVQAHLQLKSYELPDKSLSVQLIILYKQ